MFLVVEWLNLGGMIFIIYPALSSIPINICEFVDRKGMFLVKSGSMKKFGGGNSLLWGFIFNKGEPSLVSDM
jgi:hypothetical protein